MPSSISPLAHALRLLRVELTEIRAPHSGSRTAAARGMTGPSHANATGAQNAPTALQGLPAKLRSVRAQGKGNLPRTKALRLFVEAVLLDEFGEQLQLDPAFNDLVERACKAIEQDSQSAALLDEAIADLQALAS